MPFIGHWHALSRGQAPAGQDGRLRGAVRHPGRTRRSTSSAGSRRTTASPRSPASPIPSGLSLLLGLSPAHQVDRARQRRAARTGRRCRSPSRATTSWSRSRSCFIGAHAAGARSCTCAGGSKGPLAAVAAGPQLPAAVPRHNMGWVATEVGRQPWIVQGLLRTSDGVSPDGLGERGLAHSRPVRPHLPRPVHRLGCASSPASSARGRRTSREMLAEHEPRRRAVRGRRWRR